MTKKKQAHNKSWRDLQPKRAAAPLTPEARFRRRRHILKLCVFSSALLCVAGLITAMIYVHRVNPDAIRLGGPSMEVKSVYFQSDGVLSKSWLMTEFGLGSDLKMMDLDIHVLDRRLETIGQIREARVRRAFPDALIIEITEQKPVMRIRMRNATAGHVDWLVSDEGYVYEGLHYSERAKSNLPYIAGAKLKKQDGEIAPIEGVDVIADLIYAAREQTPDLFEHWKVISCESFADGVVRNWSTIEVKTKGLGKWVFRPGDFNKQLERLHFLLRNMSMDDQKQIKMIDLSLDGRAAVRVAGSSHFNGESYLRSRR